MLCMSISQLSEMVEQISALHVSADMDRSPCLQIFSSDGPLLQMYNSAKIVSDKIHPTLFNQQQWSPCGTSADRTH